MSILAALEHSDYQGTIYHTNFIGEREALMRSDFLRALLPPEGRMYITLDRAVFDGEIIANRVTSCHRKHGEIRVRVLWASRSWGGDARILSREEIIDLSGRIFADIRERSQDRANIAPAGWPFPIWGIAA